MTTASDRLLISQYRRSRRSVHLQSRAPRGLRRRIMTQRRRGAAALALRLERP